MPRSHLAIALTATLVLVPGCIAVAAAGAAVGYVFYDKNEARRDFKEGFDDTWKAAIGAVQEEGFDVADRDVPKDGAGTIEAEDLWVRVERHPEGMTRVRVRVGTFDSEENRRRSGLILERIAKALD